MKSAISFLFVLIFLALPLAAAAVDVPNFPTCSNPQGVLKVSFDSGTHGIVGNPGVFTGADKVYTVDEARTVQCFCSVDGDGIQTNWWKVSSLTQDEVEQLKKLGWVYVPSGEAWGLNADPYMAKNEAYSCKSTNNSGGSTTNTSSGTGGSILSAAATVSDVRPSVLGLASTGDTGMLLTLVVTSATSLVLGVFARKYRS